MSQGYVKKISRSNGWSSRSQCVDYWKLFLVHNCFPFKPPVMKLYTETLDKSRVCPINFGTKCQSSRSQCIDYWKWILKYNCFSFASISIMKLHTQTPHKSRRAAIYPPSPPGGFCKGIFFWKPIQNATKWAMLALWRLGRLGFLG